MIKRLLRLFSLEIRRTPQRSADRAASQGCAEYTTDRSNMDLPDRLIELQARYKRHSSPMMQPSIWSSDYVKKNVNLSKFRADNAYIWQSKNLDAAGSDLELKYYLHTLEAASQDDFSLMSRLEEDGQFGCLNFVFERFGRVSRDQLDSIIELNFLNRVFGLQRRSNFRVLDIGAGYGRLAHRMHQSGAEPEKYLCVDAIAESTYLCECYLELRKLPPPYEAVPVDELNTYIDNEKIDLAINIHSFAEMTLSAIDAWLDVLDKTECRSLFIVPNYGEELVAKQANGELSDFGQLIRNRGFKKQASEFVIQDEDRRTLLGITDYMIFFER